VDLTEKLMFDYYDNIIKFPDNHDIVQSGSPLISCIYNRLAYLIDNEAELKPRKLLIMPYLHERKIKLNRRQNTD
jgi:hypothetical protein